MACLAGRRGRGMARRRKDDASERRTGFVGFFVTPTERAALDARAASIGSSLSEFIRIVTLSDLKKPAPNARDPQSIRALKVEISRVGTNLNQLAHIANEQRALPSQQELKEAIDQIMAALEKVMQL